MNEQSIGVVLDALGGLWEPCIEFFLVIEELILIDKIIDCVRERAIGRALEYNKSSRK